ncbi:hypothetical protein FRC04_007691 [Tulasnella sp. 424]|nr:hypothetical protein FRC04_007691 [Tulasnella sp. 424]
MSESKEPAEQLTHGETDAPDPDTQRTVISGALSGKEQEKPTCRICLDDEESSSLIRPCLCRGTMQYVHIECLTAWRKSSTKENIRGGIACEQCQSKYVDVVKWRRPIQTLLAPVALGVVGGLLQVLPFGFVILWRSMRGVEEPHNFWQLWKEVLRPILTSLNPGQPASSYPIAASNASAEPIPLLECMTPRIVTGFLTAFIVATYHLALRAARTAYPLLRLAHATLLEPAQGLRLVWSLRSGIITYELLRRYVISTGEADPIMLYALFAALPYLLPEPLETVIQDLGEIEHPPLAKQHAKRVASKSRAPVVVVE